MSAHIVLASAGSHDQHTGLIHLLGSGLKVMALGPFGATPSFVLGIYLEVTPEQIDRDLELAVVLLGANGEDVTLAAGPGGEKIPVRVAQQIRMTAPREAPAGFPASAMMLVDFNGGLPMAAGEYRFRVLLDRQPVTGSDARFVVLPGVNAPAPVEQRAASNGHGPTATGRGPAWVPGTPLQL